MEEDFLENKVFTFWWRWTSPYLAEVNKSDDEEEVVGEKQTNISKLVLVKPNRDCTAHRIKAEDLERAVEEEEEEEDSGGVEIGAHT